MDQPMCNNEFERFDFFPKPDESISTTILVPESSHSEAGSTQGADHIPLTSTSAKNGVDPHGPICEPPADGGDLTWTPEEERRLVRKIDFCLLPTVWLMALMSWMDRSNIGNAEIAGMGHDLHLSSSQFSMVIIVFYFGLVTWGPISNILLARTRPSLYLPGIMLAWGALTCGMGAVQTYPQLVILRLFVGVMEAGLSPGVAFLISCWYRPEEQAKRAAAALSAALLGGAFGGLIAGGVTGSLEGARGIRGWRWLFICEGVITVAWALVAVWLLPDFPATCRRFDPQQRRMAVARVAQAGVLVHGDGHRAANGNGQEDARRGARLGKCESVIMALKDWRVWLITIGVGLLGCSTVLAYFYPILIHDMGYKSIQAQFLTVPIWGAAFVCALASGVVADRFPNHRALMMASWMGLSTIITITVCVVYNSVARYVLLVVMAGGVWASVALNIALVTSTFGDLEPEARAFALSLPPSAGNFGNVYGAYLFPDSSGPKFLLGFGVVSATLGAGALLFVAIHLLLWKRRLSKD